MREEIFDILCSQLFEKLFKNDDVVTTKLLIASRVFCTGMAFICIGWVVGEGMGNENEMLMSLSQLLGIDFYLRRINSCHFFRDFYFNIERLSDAKD